MALVGWLFGVRGSLLFGIATVPLNFFLFRSVGIANSGGITPHLFAGSECVNGFWTPPERD
jgi:hypothetical protein